MAKKVTTVVDASVTAIKPLVTSFINDTDKARTGGVTLLKELATRKLPMSFALKFFQEEKSWGKDSKGAPLAINKAEGRAKSAYDALRKAASRYEGEGKGGDFVATLDAKGFMVVKATVAPAEKSTVTKGADDKAPVVPAQDLKEIERVASIKAKHITKMAVMAFIDRERANNPDAKTLEVLDRLRKEVEGLAG